MKLRHILLASAATAAIVACDTDTDTLGTTLINNMDHLEITTDTFTITTRSIVADSVLARSSMSYLGNVRDPETGEYISASFMTQFHTLEDYEFPELDSIASRDELGDIVADSCEVRIFWDSFYGDSVTSMKCMLYELAEPMTEDKAYYSNFDPVAEGLIRTDDGALKVSKTYTLEDMNVERSTRDNTTYTKNIKLLLDKEYTDQDGNVYNNYGTYVIRKYYEEYGGAADNFKNSIRLINNVIPGFYIESTGGLGNMAEIFVTQLNVYFDYKPTFESDSSYVDTLYVGTTSLSGTQEVMQRTKYTNETGKIQELAADNTCTYLKTPSGIFTELTLPIDEICDDHDNDTINSAKFTLERMVNDVRSEYTFDIPSTVLIIPEDSLYSFFENKNVANYKTSYIASYSETNNTYTFNNIASMIKAMYQAKQNGETSKNWNKAVVIPITATYNSSSVLTKVTHDMSLSSTRLVGGSENPYNDVQISVIYSKYK